jgi:transposase
MTSCSGRESTARAVGCSECGTRARAKDHRWVTVRDAPAGSWPVRVRWRRLEDGLAWCTEPESGPELRRLPKTLRRWRSEIVAHHTIGASNGPVEAANLLIKQVRRSGRGFRNFENYRLCILVADGNNPPREDSHRPEHPTTPPQVGRVEPPIHRSGRAVSRPSGTTSWGRTVVNALKS